MPLEASLLPQTVHRQHPTWSLAELREYQGKLVDPLAIAKIETNILHTYIYIHKRLEESWCQSPTRNQRKRLWSQKLRSHLPARSVQGEVRPSPGGFIGENLIAVVRSAMSRVLNVDGRTISLDYRALNSGSSLRRSWPETEERHGRARRLNQAASLAFTKPLH